MVYLSNGISLAQSNTEVPNVYILHDLLFLLLLLLFKELFLLLLGRLVDHSLLFLGLLNLRFYALLENVLDVEIVHGTIRGRKLIILAIVLGPKTALSFCLLSLYDMYLAGIINTFHLRVVDRSHKARE